MVSAKTRLFTLSLALITVLSSVACGGNRNAGSNDRSAGSSMSTSSLLDSKATSLDSSSYGNTAGNILNGGNAAIHGDRIYYINLSGMRNIFSITIDGSDNKQLNDDISRSINIL